MFEERLRDFESDDWETIEDFPPAHTTYTPILDTEILANGVSVGPYPPSAPEHVRLQMANSHVSDGPSSAENNFKTRWRNHCQSLPQCKQDELREELRKMIEMTGKMAGEFSEEETGKAWSSAPRRNHLNRFGSASSRWLSNSIRTTQRMADNFRTLGLPCTATQEEVKSASGLKGVARLLQRDRSIFVGLGKRPYLDLLNFEDIPVIEIGS